MTRFCARDAPTRGTVTWVLSRSIATEYSHRALCHRIPSQGTATGYHHRAPITEHPSREALPRINAEEQRHNGI
ncbi:MAG: hypothetical protein MR575_04620 [Bacteroides sp.]|nr:hypothetical protein [Bacteroides sp.]